MPTNLTIYGHVIVLFFFQYVIYMEKSTFRLRNNFSVSKVDAELKGAVHALRQQNVGIAIREESEMLQIVKEVRNKLCKLVKNLLFWIYFFVNAFVSKNIKVVFCILRSHTLATFFVHFGHILRYKGANLFCILWSNT